MKKQVQSISCAILLLTACPIWAGNTPKVNIKHIAVDTVGNEIYIYGENFLNQKLMLDGKLMLGGIELQVINANNSLITAWLPPSIIAGDYQLSIEKDNQQPIITYDLTIGAAGPAGERGPQGEIGPIGPLGPQGLKGDKGDTWATGQIGPQGVPGIQGVQGTQGIKGDQGIPGERGYPSRADWDALQVTIQNMQAQITEILAKENLTDQYKSCKDILAVNANSTNGSYTIDPDGPGGNSPFPVYCDMKTDGGGWQVLFRSDDPTKWATTFGTPGIDKWGIDNKGVQASISELRLSNTVTGDRRIIPITANQVYTCSAVNSEYFWNGTKINAWNALHVGISSTTPIYYRAGYIITGQPCNNDHSSWGFGHRGWIDDHQGWGWDSLDLGPTIFQIDVR